MPDMKNTNTEWLKDIPCHWGLSKINALYTLRNQKVSDRDYPPLSVTMKGILPQLDTAAKTNAHDDRKLVMKGDFAINSRSDRRGSCGISDYDGSVSLINTVMKPNGKMDPGYYNWLFHTTEFSDEFYKWGHGIVDDLWTTNWQDMKHIDVPVPPLSEQHRIADFLDSKCSQIDEISKKIQKEIDTLEEYKKSIITEAVTKGLDPNAEMKDSGIEWIGDIPENWSLNRVANIFSERNEPGEDGLPFLSVSINSGISDKELSEEETSRQFIRADANKNKKVYPGDIVYNMMRAWQGAIGAVRTEGMVSAAYVTAKPIQTIDTRYFEYLLRTPTAIQELNKYSYGIMDFRKRLYWPYFKNISLCVPPLDEQITIADYADEIIQTTESFISSKKKQLSVLEEYKKSLIYEYVTGKKEVAYG